MISEPPNPSMQAASHEPSTQRGESSRRCSRLNDRDVDQVLAGLYRVSRMDYRTVARRALERADHEMASGSEDRLRYAALDLRMAIEALVYERAASFRDELPEAALAKWQPKQLLDVLLEVDRHADKTSILSYGVEDESGQPATKMRVLGRDRVLSLGEIKEYYARLGSYLHTATTQQVQAGKVATSERMRSRCLQVADAVRQVLSSSVWNINFKTIARLECGRCKKLIVRRLPSSDEPVLAQCRECKASYTLTREGDGKVRWTPNVQDVPCADVACGDKMELWDDQVAPGKWWRCKGCGRVNKIELTVRIVERESGQHDAAPDDRPQAGDRG